MASLSSPDKENISSRAPKQLSIDPLCSPRSLPFYLPPGSLSSHRRLLTDQEESFQFNSKPPSLVTTPEKECPFPPTESAIIVYREQEESFIINKEDSNDFIDSCESGERYYEEELLKLQSFIRTSVQEAKHNGKLEHSSQTETTFESLEENKQLKIDLAGYMKQIQDLRTEVKMAADDYSSLERAHQAVSNELQEAKTAPHISSGDMQKLIELIEDSESDCAHYWQGSSSTHLINYLSSKLEIHKSRRNRFNSKYEQLLTENALQFKDLQDKELLNLELKNLLRAKDNTISSLTLQLEDVYPSLQSTLNGTLFQRRRNEEGTYAKRPISALSIGEESPKDPVDFCEVLKDLRDITTRASKALEKSNKKPFEPVLGPSRCRNPNAPKNNIVLKKAKNYEELRKKYGSN